MDSLLTLNRSRVWFAFANLNSLAVVGAGLAFLFARLGENDCQKGNKQACFHTLFFMALNFLKPLAGCSKIVSVLPYLLIVVAAFANFISCTCKNIRFLRVALIASATTGHGKKGNCDKWGDALSHFSSIFPQNKSKMLIC